MEKMVNGLLWFLRDPFSTLRPQEQFRFFLVFFFFFLFGGPFLPGLFPEGFWLFWPLPSGWFLGAKSLPPLKSVETNSWDAVGFPFLPSPKRAPIPFWDPLGWFTCIVGIQTRNTSEELPISCLGSRFASPLRRVCYFFPPPPSPLPPSPPPLHGAPAPRALEEKLRARQLDKALLLERDPKLEGAKLSASRAARRACGGARGRKYWGRGVFRQFLGRQSREVGLSLPFNPALRG